MNCKTGGLTLVHRSSFRVHSFKRPFRQKLQLQTCRGVVAEEIVDVGGEFDGGEAEAAGLEEFAVACGGAAAGGVGVECGDDAEATEGREPLLLEPARADEADPGEAVREERERVGEAFDEVD